MSSSNLTSLPFGFTLTIDLGIGKENLVEQRTKNETLLYRFWYVREEIAMALQTTHGRGSKCYSGGHGDSPELRVGKPGHLYRCVFSGVTSDDKTSLSIQALTLPLYTAEDGRLHIVTDEQVELSINDVPYVAVWKQNSPRGQVFVEVRKDSLAA